MNKMWQYVRENLRKNVNSQIEEVLGKKYSYGQILNELESFETENRIKDPKGKKCVILCNKNIEAIKALFFCWKMDMVGVPLSMQYGKEQCDNIMNSVNPNYIMTDDIKLCKEYIHTIIYEFEGVLLCSLEYKQEEKNLDDVSLMMCTSGTTGRPKASLFSPEALQYNVAAIIDYFPLTNADTILISRPIYHSAVLVGEVLVSLSVGANIIFYSGEYNPIIICNILDRYNITASCGTPTIFKGISSCLSHRREIGKLHTIVLSGEYLLQEYAEDIRKCFPYTKIFNVYGLTEAGPRVSYLSPEKFDLIPQSVGQSLNGVEIKIVNEKGIEMSAYEKGKVWVKTPSLMLGYYQDILLTNNKIQNGWFDTGDIGMLDEMHNLYILGRNDDMIIRFGMNIFPQEVENKILRMNEVKEVLVYGQLIKGIEQIVAEIILCEGYESESCMDIMKKLSGFLPPYMMPQHVKFVKTFMRNSSGKIIRPPKKIRTISD